MYSKLMSIRVISLIALTKFEIEITSVPLLNEQKGKRLMQLFINNKKPKGTKGTHLRPFSKFDAPSQNF